MNIEEQQFAQMYYLGIQKAAIAIAVISDTANETGFSSEELASSHDRVLIDLAKRVGLSVESVSDDVDQYMLSDEYRMRMPRVVRSPEYRMARRGMLALANGQKETKLLSNRRRVRR